MKYDVASSPCDHQSELHRGFYDTAEGSCAHSVKGSTTEESKFVLYHELSADVLVQLKQYEADVWVGLNTSRVDHRVLFYNAYLGAFTDYTLYFKFEMDAGKKDGVLHMGFSQETWLADPYYNWAVLITDILFVVLIGRMFVSELQEVVPACMNGADGFLDYWDFWNGVDWAAMLFGFGCVGYWVFITVQVAIPLREAIEALPTPELDKQILENRTYYPTADLDNRLKGLDKI